MEIFQILVIPVTFTISGYYIDVFLVMRLYETVSNIKECSVSLIKE